MNNETPAKVDVKLESIIAALIKYSQVMSLFKQVDGSVRKVPAVKIGLDKKTNTWECSLDLALLEEFNQDPQKFGFNVVLPEGETDIRKGKLKIFMKPMKEDSGIIIPKYSNRELISAIDAIKGQIEH